MSACGAARLAGVGSVLVPKLAAVFSAFGISFSDIGQTYEVGLPAPTREAARSAHDTLLDRAERDMFQEGFELASCDLAWSLVIEQADGTLATPAGKGLRLALALAVWKLDLEDCGGTVRASRR